MSGTDSPQPTAQAEFRPAGARPDVEMVFNALFGSGDFASKENP